MSDYINSFIDAMDAAGCAPANASDIKDGAENKLIRGVDDGRGKKTLYYTFHIEGDRASGRWYSCKSGVSESWHSKSTRKWTAEEKKEWKAKRDADRAAREKELQDGYNSIAKEAAALWKKSPKAKDHKYLKKKSVSGKGLRVHEGGLLIPLKDAKSKLWSLQTILEDGTKFNSFVMPNGKWAKGGKKQGCYHSIIGKDVTLDTICICEGYATGATIAEATSLAVVVALDAGNLKPVAKAVRGKYPDAVIIVCADNDSQKDDNVGREKGAQAASAVDGFSIYPEFEPTEDGTDFNDLAAIKGLEAVKERILPVIEQTPTPDYDLAVPEDFMGPSWVPVHDLDSDTAWMKRAKWTNEKAGIYDKDYALHNSELLITHALPFGGCFVLDTFCDRAMVIKPLPWDDKKKFSSRQVEPEDITRMRTFLEVKGLKLAKGCTKDVIMSAAGNIKVNPALECLENLKWDSKRRLDNWLIHYLGAKFQPEQYVQRVGSCWLIAAAKRIYEPGAPFHHMLVLEGGQAAGKSTALRTMATFGTDTPLVYFSDRITFDHIDKQDFASFAAGHVILEFQELSGMGKKDRNKVKQWITQTIDEYRKPYEPIPTQFPRQFVLAGTTNESHWLSDPTGDRRFWPVKVSDRINNDKLFEERGQIWAEAVHRYKAGELWYIKPDDPVYKLMQDEQTARYLNDPWEDIIMDWIGSQFFVKIEDIYKECLNIPKERWDMKSRNRITSCLTKAGWESKSIWCPYKKKSVRQWANKNNHNVQEGLLIEEEKEIAF